MSTSQVLEFTRQALLLAIVLSAVPVGVVLIVGFIVNLVQAATQLTDQTIAFAPKLIAIYLAILLLGGMGCVLLFRRSQEWFQAIEWIGLLR